MNMLRDYLPAEGVETWLEIGELLELAKFTKNAIFSDEIAMIHHAMSHSNPVSGEACRQYAIVGLDNIALAIAIDSKNIGTDDKVVKVPLLKEFLACDSEEKFENLARPSKASDRIDVNLSNILVVPPFIFEAISVLEKTTFSAAFMKIKEALAKLDRIEAAKKASNEENSKERKEVEATTSKAEKYQKTLHWLWEASRENSRVTPFPTSAATKKHAQEWAQKVTRESIVLTAGGRSPGCLSSKSVPV